MRRTGKGAKVERWGQQDPFHSCQPYSTAPPLALPLHFFSRSTGQLPAKPKLESHRKMIFREGPFCILLLFLLVSFSTFSFSVGDCVHGSSGRSLLQATTNCPVDFENMNYTILTSRCKDPYPAEPCCDALKDLACPYADQINNLANNCAKTMLSYIEKSYPYPSTLFSVICFQGTDSLPCPGNGTAPASPADTTGTNSGYMTSAYSWIPMLMSTATLLLVQLL